MRVLIKVIKHQTGFAFLVFSERGMSIDNLYVISLGTLRTNGCRILINVLHQLFCPRGSKQFSLIITLKTAL